MLDILSRITQEVNSARDLDAALSIIVKRTQAAMGTQVCSVYLLDEETNQYLFMATQGLNQSAVGKVSLGVSEGLVGLVGERAETINLDDAPSHPNYRYVEEIGEDPFHSFLGVPMIHHRKVLGVLVVQQREARRFDETEESFLITLSSQLAIHIVHAQATGTIHHIRDRKSASGNVQGASFVGSPGAPGIAIGNAVVMFPPAELHTVPERLIEDVEAEMATFQSALEETRAEINLLGKKMADQLRPAESALFEAYSKMLDDDVLGAEVTARIEQGYWAQSALRTVVEGHIDQFEMMEDSYLREKASDVRDLGQRVLAKLQQSEGSSIKYSESTVLVGEELTLAMFMAVPRDNLAGLVARKGSANSHVAILARAMGIPTVIGAEDLPISLMDDQPLIVDGFQGAVLSHPTREQTRQYERVMREEALLVEGLDDLNSEPSETPDGHRIKLWVNTGLLPDVTRSLDRGAEGVGLYRTEFNFMMQDRFPTEEEQRIIYRDHLLAFAPRPVTMRTLDIGGDKTLSYFPINEENPFLGWRGIRVTLDHPEIFLAQVRAMIRAYEGIDGHLRIMLPMISSITEVDEALRLINQCYREIIEEGIEVEMPDVGVMIEVPAAVYQAEDIIKRVDFLSVGSNDLIQYMLAVDRNNAQVAALYQDFHPAVLQALNYVVKAAHSQQKKASICGELAGNPSATILLMAMGYDTLSMSSTNLPIIKWVVRSVKMTHAKKVLRKVLSMDNAHLIKNYMDDQLRQAGLRRVLREHGVKQPSAS